MRESPGSCTEGTKEELVTRPGLRPVSKSLSGSPGPPAAYGLSEPQEQGQGSREKKKLWGSRMVRRTTVGSEAQLTSRVIPAEPQFSEVRERHTTCPFLREWVLESSDWSESCFYQVLEEGPCASQLISMSLTRFLLL